MFKNLILASATAAVAFTAAADFSSGTFDMAAAEARAAGVLAQTQLKPTKPGTPGRTPSVQPSEPTTGKTPTLQPAATTDLYITPHFPASFEGLPGHYYCAKLWGADHTVSKSVMFKVHNGGNTPAGPVKVVVEFKGYKSVTRTVNMTVANDAAHGFDVPLPANAWHSGTASFTIRVDPQNQVAETNEHNNVVSSFCAGPQG